MTVSNKMTQLDKIKGYTYGVIASVSYGLNPLFALPLYATGIEVDSVLFYRYMFAIVLLGIMMVCSGQSFTLKKKEIIPLILMGLLFSFSSLFLFMSFNYMDAGIASTILFVYPIIVAVIMTLFFHEHLGRTRIAAIIMAFVGIAMLYKGEGEATLSLVGVGCVFLSSLVYALYIVGVNHSILKTMPGLKLTFYAVLFGSLVYVVRLRGGADLQMLHEPLQWVNAVGLALFPTLISLVTIAKSIRYIGSTAAAILGALEPMTALVIGVTLFDETLTGANVTGILLILSAVTLIVVGKRGWVRLKQIWSHIWAADGQ